MEQSTSRRASLSRRLALSVATLLLLAGLFGAGELAVRLANVPADVQSPEAVDLALWAAHPCFDVKGSGDDAELVEYRGAIGAYLNRPGPPARYPLKKRPGQHRIAVVGESSGKMFEDALLRTVRTQHCEEEWQVLPCAIAGGDLVQIERRFHQALETQPDSVVLLLGHNLYFQNPSNVASLRIEWLRARSRLLSWLVKATHAHSEPPGPEKQLPAFEAALGRMTSAAQARGTTLMIQTMPSNRMFRPLEAEHPVDDSRLIAAMVAEDRGELQRALALVGESQADRATALGAFRSAELQRKVGNLPEALRKFDEAISLDPMRFRATTEVNAILRRFAARPPALLLDTDASLISRAPQGIPGWESFLDNCHPKAHAMDEAVRSALGMLRPGACGTAEKGDNTLETPGLALGALAAQYGANASTAKREVWLDNVPFLVESFRTPTETILEEAGQSLWRDPRVANMPATHRAAFESRIAEGIWQRGDREQALSLAEKSARTDSPEAHFQLARMMVRSSRMPEARSALERTIQLSPDRALYQRYRDALDAATAAE